jgi:hypothetical protein
MNNYTATDLLSTLEDTNDTPMERMVELYGQDLLDLVHAAGLIEYLAGARGDVVNLGYDIDPGDLTHEQVEAIAKIEGERHCIRCGEKTPYKGEDCNLCPPCEAIEFPDTHKKIVSETEDTLRELYVALLRRTANNEMSRKNRNKIWELSREIRVLASKFGGLKGGA